MNEAAEIARLKAELADAKEVTRRYADEVAELDAQVRLLVRTEHRLTRAQVEADRQVARVRALSSFALAFDPSDEPLALAIRATALLREWFAVDRVGVVVPTGRGVGVLLGDSMHEAPPSLVEACRTSDAPFVRSMTDVEWGRQLVEAVEHVPADAVGVIACIPLHRVDVIGLVCWRRPNPLASYFSEAPDERHQPFLMLLGQHLGHALDNASLTRDLRHRTEELGEKNRELSRSLESVREAHERLAQASKLEAIGRLAGGIAHDFNNLLMVILTNAELLRQDLPPATRAHDDLAPIVAAAERARDITRQLLLYSRKQEARPEELRLDAVVDEFARIAARLLGERVELRITHDRRGGAVRIERSRLDQVLLNLATNARDAMGGVGTLSIETRAASPREQALLSEPARSALAMVVSDTGVGMDEATRARIFEPFFTTKDAKGTGLGLAIVQSVAMQAGGTVLVDSTLGQGSSFTIVLPECESVVREPEPVEARASVLVVEDESLMRDSLRRVLSRAGYRVLLARDGREALGIALRDDIDVVVTDVIMPGMSGPELARALRADRPGIPILFMSGHTFDALSEADLGAREHLLTKPFPPSLLLEAIDVVLAARVEGRASSRPLRATVAPSEGSDAPPRPA